MRASTPTLLAVLALGAAACGGDDSDPRDLQAEVDKPDSQAQTAASDDRTASGDQETTDSQAQDVQIGHDSGGGRTVTISASDFPAGTWPLTIESGELRCEDTDTARTIIFRANGQDYPINGVPKGGKIIGIEPIWKQKDDPNSPGTRMDISPLFKKGYALCD